MSICTVKKLTCAADLEGLEERLVLMARAAIGAGYEVELHTLRFQPMLFVGDKHFYPLTDWAQCVRLIVDTGSFFTIYGTTGSIRVENENAGYCVESRTPTTDKEYREQMCEAVVTNIAKACPF